MNSPIVTYYGHSCFLIEYCGQKIVLDPYKDGSVHDLPPLHLTADFVYCSHDHHDHNNFNAVYIPEEKEPLFQVTELETDHDEKNGKLRGKNIVRIFDFDGYKIAHFGDLGRMLNDYEIAVLSDLDCILIPVGGVYTIDAYTAKSIIDAIQPHIAIPMHYRVEHFGLLELSEISSFATLFDNVEFVNRNILLTKQQNYKVVVLNPFGQSLMDKTSTLKSKGFNCCQSVLALCSDYTGIDKDLIQPFGSGFAGGMFAGEACGAVTGAIMSIGLACRDYPNDTSQLVQNFERIFKDKFGALACRDILKVYGRKICRDCIAYGAETAIGIIQDTKRKEN